MVIKILAVSLVSMLQFSQAGNYFSNSFPNNGKSVSFMDDSKLVFEKEKLSFGYVPKKIEMNPATKKFYTEGVVNMDSMPEKLMLEATYKWLSEVKYVNTLGSKGIILDEAAFNRIIVNQYFIPSEELDTKKVRFRLLLEFRDGRFKFIYTDFSYYLTGSKIDFEEVDYVSNPEQGKLLRKLLAQADHNIETSVNELIVYLKDYKMDESW